MEPTEIVVVEAVPVPEGARAALVIDVEPPPGPALAVPPGAAAPARPGPVACAVADGLATSTGVRLGLLDAALVRWLGAHVAPVRAEAPGAPPCDGLPGVDAVAVPPGGRIVGLRHAAAGAATSGDVQLHQIGVDARWWHLEARAGGTVAFDHGDDPPTRLVVRAAEALVVPPARTVDVPRGGAVIVDVGAPLTHARAVQGDVIRVDLTGGAAVVSSPGSADLLSADVVVRAGDAPPEAWQVRIGAPPGPDPRELRVPVDGRRRLVLDAPATAAWIAAPSVAEVVLTGTRLVVTGKAPGRTALVVVDAQGPHVVPLAVGR